MDIRKPRPWHNWREFLKELGTIALGVGVALAAEQGVEYFHWREQVAESREFIATETANNLVTAITRSRVAPCVERRLDALAAILDDTAKAGGRLPPVGDIGVPSRRVWRDGVWESVIASQAATHLSRGELAGLADMYKFVKSGETVSYRELDAWNDLSAMAGPGRQLAAAEETGLRQALSHARSYNRGTTSIGSILLLQAKAMALPFSPEDVRKMNDALQASLTETKASPFAPTPTSQICGPIGAVAPHYGQAPYASVPGFADQNARQLDDFAASLRQAR